MSDPTSPAGQTHTIYDGKTLREVIQMCEQAHACANELQRQLSETQQLCVELEEELAAAQVTIEGLRNALAQAVDALNDPERGVTALRATIANLNNADHDAAIRADERKRVLEEVKELVISMLDPKICGRRTAVEESLIYAISTRLRAMAAQPEEAKG